MRNVMRRPAKSRRRLLSAWVLSCGIPGIVLAAGDPAFAARFEKAEIRFEQNATDGDVEVVIEAQGGDEGLAMLTVLGPDGRTVVDARAPDESTLGIRQFVFESPEPSDQAALKAAYPEGVYHFSGATASGKKLAGEARLSHELPGVPSFVSPHEDAEGVPAAGLVIEWKPVPHITRYIVEIENDDLGVKLVTTVPASSHTFSVPAGFLAPDTEYDIGVGAVAPNGNASFVETSFTTVE